MKIEVGQKNHIMSPSIQSEQLNDLKTVETIAGEDEMILIPAGEFQMGSLDGAEGEKPVRSVYLDSYYIDTTPVTNAEFEEFVIATGYDTTAERNGEKPEMLWRTSATHGREDHPVVSISWYDATEYAKWVGKRLPTEAEWEKAARGGLTGKKFPWGNQEPSNLTNWGRTQTANISVPPTSSVRAFPPNSYGIYDMAGNVWEWCEDWFVENAYEILPGANPRGPIDGDFKARRGASWNIREGFRLRCANRGAMPPERYWTNIGFRCVRSIDTI
jgi:sulfatase modifying factor 1